MLVKMGRGVQRLFREGDEFHPDRAEGPTHPSPENLPKKYKSLLDWYLRVYSCVWTDLSGLLALVGIGASGLHDVSENHDKYVAEALYERFHDRPDKYKRPASVR
jgi:hypothetical protein